MIQKEHERFSAMFKAFMEDLSEEMKVQFLQVEESWVWVEVLEKEWIFTQGMKDGAQLWMALSGSKVTIEHLQLEYC